jgi:hypothetical protein
MADNIPNPEDIIAREGRFAARASSRWPAVTVAHIDFDILFGQLTVSLLNAFRDHPPLRRLYDGTAAEIDANIIEDIDSLVGQGLFELWNRLRIVAETYDVATRNNIFQRKAPSMDGFCLPRIFASMFSAIGPLRIMDTFRDTTVIYAPAQATRDNYGRAQAPPIDRLRVLRLMAYMRTANIPVGTVQGRGSQGSYFTTINLDYTVDATYNFHGSFNRANYTRNDVVMSMFFDDRDDEGNPFEDLSLSIGYVNDEDTIEAFSAIPAPREDAPLDGPTRHVWADYQINRFGLAPAANVPVNARGQGIYVLGRGFGQEASCSLAREITHLEIDAICRHRLLHQAGDPAPAPNQLQANVGLNAPPV